MAPPGPRRLGLERWLGPGRRGQSWRFGEVKEFLSRTARPPRSLPWQPAVGSVGESGSAGRGARPSPSSRGQPQCADGHARHRGSALHRGHLGKVLGAVWGCVCVRQTPGVKGFLGVLKRRGRGTFPPSRSRVLRRSCEGTRMFAKTPEATSVAPVIFNPGSTLESAPRVENLPRPRALPTSIGAESLRVGPRHR